MGDLTRIVGKFVLLIASSCSAAAATCENFDKARDAAYQPYIRLILDDFSAARKSDGTVPANTILSRMASKYEQLVHVGDMLSLRKLISLGLFTAVAAKHEPLEVTFKLVCELAKNPQAPQNVLDPLVCATIALDGSRRDDTANRTLALAMIERARKNLAMDHDPAGAKYLLETISPILAACSGQS